MKFKFETYALALIATSVVVGCGDSKHSDSGSAPVVKQKSVCDSNYKIDLTNIDQFTASKNQYGLIELKNAKNQTKHREIISMTSTKGNKTLSDDVEEEGVDPSASEKEMTVIDLKNNLVTFVDDEGTSTYKFAVAPNTKVSANGDGSYVVLPQDITDADLGEEIDFAGVKLAKICSIQSEEFAFQIKDGQVSSRSRLVGGVKITKAGLALIELFSDDEDDSEDDI